MDIDFVIDIIKNISEYQRSNYKNRYALYIAIKSLEKQKELKTNCEGSCSNCHYCGNGCANDLLLEEIAEGEKQWKLIQK